MIFLLYDILLHVAALFLLPYYALRAAVGGKRREGLPERFGFVSSGKLERLKGGPVVWVHAVSVGETKAALIVLKKLKGLYPGVKVAFSTVTETGNRTAAAEGKGLIDALMYLPVDIPWAVGRVLRRIRPGVLVVMEKEVWPNLYRLSRRMSIPVVVANGTLSGRSFRRYGRLGLCFKDVFSCVSFYCAQTEGDRDRAVSLGVDGKKAAAFGNVKFDLNPRTFDPAFIEAFKGSVGIKPGDTVVTSGSTHPGEDEIMLEAFLKLKECGLKGLKLVIAPRHPERFDGVEDIIRKKGLTPVRRTRGGEGEVILLDTMGELLAAYSISDCAIVAGSFVPGIGGHNLLEPAFFGKPVVYGEHLTAYLPMAALLEGGGGGVRAADGGLFHELKALLEDKALRERTGKAAKAVVEANSGAALKTAQAIGRFLR